jgi:hypothetical protein
MPKQSLLTQENRASRPAQAKYNRYCREKKGRSTSGISCAVPIAWVCGSSTGAILESCFTLLAHAFAICLSQYVPFLCGIPRLHKCPLCLVRVSLRADFLHSYSCAILRQNDVFLLHLLLAALGEFVRVEEDLRAHVLVLWLKCAVGGLPGSRPIQQLQRRRRGLRAE